MYAYTYTYINTYTYRNYKELDVDGPVLCSPSETPGPWTPNPTTLSHLPLRSQPRVIELGSEISKLSTEPSRPRVGAVLVDLRAPGNTRV